MKNFFKSFNKKVFLHLLWKYLWISVGCVIYALGVALFLDANNVVAGGVTGISMIIGTLTGWDTGVIIILINVPLFILGFFFFGKKFALSTMYSTVVSSLLIELFDKFIPAPHIENYAVAGVIGGALFGLGLGIVFRMGSTTGGSDIVVKILRRKFRYLKTGVISFCIDACVVIASAFVYRSADNSFDWERIFFTILSIATTMLVFDWTLYGGNPAKMVYIITDDDHSRAMCARILKELDIGATYLNGEGAYTGNNKRIVLCVVKNISLPKLRDIIHEEDPRAFTIVTSAKEIYGEGYIDPNAEDL
jgi:uncharacterized membrane-anchored protein YitT (DUF2179 family)